VSDAQEGADTAKQKSVINWTGQDIVGASIKRCKPCTGGVSDPNRNDGDR